MRHHCDDADGDDDDDLLGCPDKPARLIIRLVLDLFLMVFVKLKKSANTETAMLSSMKTMRNICSKYLFKIFFFS